MKPSCNNKQTNPQSRTHTVNNRVWKSEVKPSDVPRVSFPRSQLAVMTENKPSDEETQTERRRSGDENRAGSSRCCSVLWGAAGFPSRDDCNLTHKHTWLPPVPMVTLGQGGRDLTIEPFTQQQQHTHAAVLMSQHTLPPSRIWHVHRNVTSSTYERRTLGSVSVRWRSEASLHISASHFAQQDKNTSHSQEVNRTVLSAPNETV